MSVGNLIITEFERPDPELIEAFRGIPVANIDDNMGRVAAVAAEIVPFNKKPLLGPAFTVKVPQGDNLMFHKAMDMAQPGDIIVIDAGGSMSRSIFGELMVTYCTARGIGGIIVDGCIRDSDALAEAGIPIYARGATPDGPYKNGPGEINTTISFGGRVVRPGDIVIGDADGIIFVKPEDAKELAEAARALSKNEEKIIARIHEECVFDRPWVDKKLAEIGTEIR